MSEFDVVDRPQHYNSHPAGIEVIEITGPMNFCLGNAVKYLARADLKGKPVEDLNKAQKYLEFAIDLNIPLEPRWYADPDLCERFVDGYGSVYIRAAMTYILQHNRAVFRRNDEFKAAHGVIEKEIDFLTREQEAA